MADMLDARRIERAIERALQRFRTMEGRRHDRRAELERELGLVEATERRLVDAVARGDAVEPLLARLRAEQDRRRAIGAELTSLTTRQAAPDRRGALLADLQAAAADMKRTLALNAPEARNLLKKLVRGRLSCEPR